MLITPTQECKSNDTWIQTLNLFKKNKSKRNLGLCHSYIQILCTTTANISVKIQSYIFIMHYTSTVPNSTSCAKGRDSSVADKETFQLANLVLFPKSE